MKLNQLTKVDTENLPVRKRGAATSAEIATAAAAAAVTAAAAAAAAAAGAKINSPQIRGSNSSPRPPSVQGPKSPHGLAGSSASQRPPASHSPKSPHNPHSPNRGVRKRNQQPVVQRVQRIHKVVQAVPAVAIAPALQAQIDQQHHQQELAAQQAAMEQVPQHLEQQQAARQQQLMRQAQLHAAQQLQPHPQLQADSTTSGLAAQQQQQRQRMLDADQLEADTSHMTGTSWLESASSNMVTDEMPVPVTDEASADEEGRWAEQVLSSDWITSFDENATLDDVGANDEESLQGLMSDD